MLPLLAAGGAWLATGWAWWNRPEAEDPGLRWARRLGWLLGVCLLLVVLAWVGRLWLPVLDRLLVGAESMFRAVYEGTSSLVRSLGALVGLT